MSRTVVQIAVMMPPPQAVRMRRGLQPHPDALPAGKRRSSSGGGGADAGREATGGLMYGAITACTGTCATSAATSPALPDC